jgi:regulator of protease activity HflC (stomatin/prohibitin superfamily)
VTAEHEAYITKFSLQMHIEACIAKKAKGSGPKSALKFMMSDASDFFTDLSKKLKANGGVPVDTSMTAEQLAAKDKADAQARREKDAKAEAERDAADAANEARQAAMEASGKKVGGGLHKFDASEVDIEGGAATADDFMDAFGF